jgi:large subunit ribosomal protein L35
MVASCGIVDYKAQASIWPQAAAGPGNGVLLVMTKLKTKRAAAKRFRFTGSGKPVRRRANHRHNLTDQPKSVKVEARRGVLVADADVRMVKRMLPYGG